MTDDQQTRRWWARRPSLVAGVSLVTVLVTVLVVTVGVLARIGADAASESEARARAVAAAPQEDSPEDDLLVPEELRPLGPNRQWLARTTDENLTGSGLNSSCQESRFADPDGKAALVRSFEATGAHPRTTVQTVEVSRSRQQAARAYATTLRWYAGCRVARLQLLDSERVDGVGDRADVLTLRVGNRPVTTLTVALSRLGPVTSTTVTTSRGGTPPTARAAATTLATAVRKLCPRSGTASCSVQRPRLRSVPPPASGEQRGLLSVVDLPPVGDVSRPWVGTASTLVTADRPTTSCERVGPFAAGAARARSRTYLIPQAGLPARFGLGETYARFRTDKAAATYVERLRRSVAGCEKREMGTEVSAERRRDGAARQVSAWDLTTEVSEDEKVRFRFGVVRVGRTVAVLALTPAEQDDMSTAAFDGTLDRAGERLGEL